MIQIKVDSKRYHGEYYTAKIYESRRECINAGGTIVDYKDLAALKSGVYCESIEGLCVPVLKISTVNVTGRGKHTYIYFPRLRMSQRKAEFSYNIDLVSNPRYRLTYNEKAFAMRIAGGQEVFEAATVIWQGKKVPYYYATVKRLFKDTEFTNYLFEIMAKSLREELEELGVTKATIANEIAKAVLERDPETGEKVRVPQNIRLWGLNKASDLLERQPVSTTNNLTGTFNINPTAILQAMTTLSPNDGNPVAVALISDSSHSDTEPSVAVDSYGQPLLSSLDAPKQ